MFAARNMVFASAAFSPLSLSPALWLDASDASTLYDSTVGGSLVAADGAIARWEDKSGNGRHATQSTGVSQPLRKTGIQNGRDVARFDGANDYMAGSLPALGAGEYTVFIASKQNSSANYETIITLGGDANYSALIPTKSHTDYLFVGSIFNDYLQTTNSLVGNKIISIKRSGSTGYAWINGSATSPASASIVSQNIVADYKIGGLPVYSQMLNGDVLEVIVFPTALSDTDRQAVESYLNAKWAIY